MTTGLKKVTDDMKTKNRADRSGAVPSSAPTLTPAVSKGGVADTLIAVFPTLEDIIDRSQHLGS